MSLPIEDSLIGVHSEPFWSRTARTVLREVRPCSPYSHDPVLVGFDLAEVASVAEALGAPGYVSRVYTRREAEDCRNATGALDPARLAERFAAKEAVLKVLPVGEGIALTSIEVVLDDRGAPRVSLTGSAATAAAASGIRDLALSLSRSGGEAAAVVVATYGS